MKNKFIYFITLGLLAVFNVVTMAQKDSVVIYWLSPVEVTAKQQLVGDKDIPIEKENLSKILDKNGFTLIRKGVFFAQDIFVDGFKRSDINVVIDGERYHSACPNRMDSPLTRINTSELQSITLQKTSAALQAGLAGMVQFKRSFPAESLKLKSGFSKSFGSLNSYDATVSIEKSHHRLNLRYATGKPYENGDGKSFSELYPYKDDFDYKLAEGSFYGGFGNWKYTASFTYTEDVSFPYLLMDERLNRVFNGSVSYKNNKIYFNYTRHIMDNGLRKSPNNMFMETDAKNLTIGAVGSNYEIFYRNWNDDNYLTVPGKFLIKNHLIPDVSYIAASGFHQLSLGELNLSAKLGLVYESIGDKDRMDFYKAIYPDAKDSRFFVTFSTAVNYMKAFSNKAAGGIILEAASDAPDIETLYISVKKPAMKPQWSGNPDLNQPVRATLRAMLNYDFLSLELYGTRVWNYINLTSITTPSLKYLTYKNIDAYMFGVNASISWKYINSDLSYIYAENTTTSQPLSEIPPLRISTTVTTPAYHGISGFVRHTYNDAQTRIDENLNESPTPQWNRFDMGLSFNYKYLTFTFSVDNLTNANYYQHLSYARDPFSSKTKVFEPGRIFRLNVRVNKLFN